MDNSVWLCRHYFPEAECKQCKVDKGAAKMAEIICHAEPEAIVLAVRWFLLGTPLDVPLDKPR